MTVFVLRDGKLVEKTDVTIRGGINTSMFPTPAVSRFEAMESPVTGQTISSERQRQRDMAAVDCFDRRDLPHGFTFKKGRFNGGT